MFPIANVIVITVFRKPHSHGVVELVKDTWQGSLKLGSNKNDTWPRLTQETEHSHSFVALVIHSVIVCMSIGAHRAMAGFALGSELLKTFAKQTTCYCVFSFSQSVVPWAL